jgi:hypothetical protein
MTRHKIIYNRIPSEEYIQQTYTLRSQDIRGFLETLIRRVAGDFQPTLTSLPFSARTKKVSCGIILSFKFLFILWWECVCVINKRPLSAHHVVKRHQQTSRAQSRSSKVPFASCYSLTRHPTTLHVLRHGIIAPTKTQRAQVVIRIQTSPSVGLRVNPAHR